MNAVAHDASRKRGRRPDKVLAAIRVSLLKLLESNSFEDITTRDIIVESGVSPATFYRHYMSKRALLEAVADEEIDTLVAISAGFHASTWETSLAQIRHVDENRALWSVLLNGGAAGYVREGFIRRLTVEYSDERWRSETWLPRELAIRFSVSTMVEITSWWLTQDPHLPTEIIAEIFEGLTVRPTLPENAPPRRTLAHGRGGDVKARAKSSNAKRGGKGDFTPFGATTRWLG